MRSIQVRLIGLLAIAMTLLSAVAGGSLYAYLRHTLTGEFDRSLDLRCRTLRSLVTVKPGRQYDVDIHTAVDSEFYRITDAAGKIVAQSTGPMPIAGPTAIDIMTDVKSDHDAQYRALTSRFRPFSEDDDEHVVTPAAVPILTIVIARDRRALDDRLFTVAVSIAATVAALSLAAVAATAWIVRGGLHVLRRLAADAAAIDVTESDARFSTQSLPVELRPIASRLNDMLGRVSEAMTRERRFTADVAHELRTPIAELRSAAEVALRSPRDTALGRLALTQARDISVQMQTVVSVLLSIVRKDAGIENLKLVPVALASLTEKTLEHFGPAADHVACDISPTLAVIAEPILLAAVLDNLIGNALHYGADGGDISIRAEAGADCVWVSIENTQNALEPSDIEHLFEPFWRKDAARSDGAHVGLGLTLARSYCRVMKADIIAVLPAPHTLRITVTLGRAADGPPAVLEAVLTAGAYDA